VGDKMKRFEMAVEGNKNVIIVTDSDVNNDYTVSSNDKNKINNLNVGESCQIKFGGFIEKTGKLLRKE
jgi:hypothetical protein